MAKLPFLSQVTTHISSQSQHFFHSFFPSVCRSQLVGYTTTTRVFWTSLLSFGERLLAPLLEVRLAICNIACPIYGCIWILQMSTFWVTRSWTSRGAATSTRIQHSLSLASQTGDIFSPCMKLSCNFILPSKLQSISHPCHFEHVNPPP